MNASDFVSRYWNLEVQADMPGGPFRTNVSINKYLIATQHSIGKIQENQQAVFAKIPHGALDHGQIVRIKNGKASPDDLETFLGLAIESGALKANDTAIQQWADANLGVDCTGFAIAYLVEIGALEWDATLSGGASCPWIYSMVAKKNWLHTRYAAQPELWSLDDIQPNDLILWMQSDGGPETKKPGHISVVVNVSPAGVECAESNGSPDENGHSGPRGTTRIFGKIISAGGKNPKRWWQVGTGVIVVRPPAGVPEWERRMAQTSQAR
jgi:hypothetical protein